jgi:two-component system sensor histidine kinase PilS (NtrC family)
LSQASVVAPALPGAWGGPAGDGSDTWRPLRYFNLYRATLAGLLVGLVLTGAAPKSFGDLLPGLFLATAGAYLGFAALCALGLRLRWPTFPVQVGLQVLGDTLALTLMLLSSGGVRSGFGMLLVVAVAGGSILSPGRTAVLFAAVASVAVLLQEVLGPHALANGAAALTEAGSLGAALFATALLAHLLARRVRESEALAHQRAADLASLARLNEHILQRMQSGILAADADGRVRLANESARRLLGLARLEPGTRVAEASPELAALVGDWRREGAVASRTFRPAGAGVEVFASLAPIAQPGSGAALLFLEDMASVTQRAQHLKLVSLGRLTASIAHEIRNPLAAISHAAQLLQESPELGVADQRLTRIITEQSHRLNAVIGNVLQLSRRRDADLQRFALGEWLGGLLAELTRQRGLAPGDIVVEVEPADLEVRADPSQLHQVLQNLCENGLRYARTRPRLRLVAGVSAATERPYLLVCDSGPGVAPEAAEHLFEPFFTTEGKGTGLGLYIARELCEANQAVLEHLGRDQRGHCFRITFTHPARRGSVSP